MSDLRSPRRVITLFSAVIATALIAAMAPATASAAPAKGTISGTVIGAASCADIGGPFPDVTDKNAHCDNIIWLAGTGITKPEGGKFKPGNAVTRGSMTAFLFRLQHPNKPSPKCDPKAFRDVDAKNVFCGYITWAKKQGIAKGYGDGTYGSDRGVTRAAMAAFLKRIGHSGATQKCSVAPFKDVPKGDAFCGVITWLVSNGITVGVGDGSRYAPTEVVTRQSMATFLNRMVAFGAAPGISLDRNVPLNRAGVVAIDTRNGTGYYAATSADGTFRLSVPAGDYRVCAEASTVLTVSKKGWVDGCAGRVAWPWNSPTPPSAAPITRVSAGKTAAASIQLGNLPKQFNGRRGETPRPPRTAILENPLYKFYDLQYARPNQFGSDEAGKRVGYATYDPCVAIPYVIQGVALMPPFGLDMVHRAVRRVSAVSGFRFVYEGYTNETPSYPRTRDLDKFYGDRAAPLLISWTQPGVLLHGGRDMLDGNTVGYGGGMFGDDGTGLAAVDGFVYLDSPELQDIVDQQSYGPGSLAQVEAAIVHELMHALGLGHVEYTDSLMFWSMQPGVVDFGPSDLERLALLGNVSCKPTASGNARSLVVPTEPTVVGMPVRALVTEN